MTSSPSRALAQAIEPFAGQVYFAPECHRGYAALGFGPSPGALGGVEMPDGVAYFCSRGAMLGQAPGEVIAAAFAIFNPAMVVPAVTYGWTLTDAATIAQVRSDGAAGQLRRILGDRPQGLDRAVELLQRATEALPLPGKPMFAGAVAHGLTGDALTDAWRLTDRLREYRGDAHVNAWSTEGFEPVEIVVLTELDRGTPVGSSTRTHGWVDDDVAAALQRLTDRGLVADAKLTEAGRAARAGIEAATDAACAPIVANLGDDIGELTTLVAGWSQDVLAAGGFPAR